MNNAFVLDENGNVVPEEIATFKPMSNDDYIKTIRVNGTDVKLGLDDYGQCYFIQYVEPKTGDFVEQYLGTYNTNYMEEIYGLLDNTYWELYNKEFFGESMTKEELSQLNNYKELFRKEYEDDNKEEATCNSNVTSS